VSVPNVVGLTQAAATSAITSAGLVLGTVTTQSSATVAAGSVISQSPGAGASVTAGSAVNLMVSTGPASVSVPDVPTMSPATVLRGSATLFWNNVAGETGYDVGWATYNTKKRACGALGILRTLAADVTTTTHTRSGGGTFCYAVRAFNASGTSAWSTILIVTIPRK
jgi:hypothetical protein